ncbi:MAG: hypothetical protein HY001_04860 [Candidatus Portnoybacteria bacterium]|nr:hypothetical protein [Candidatus Portnoybacteria bacterium]
MEKEIGKVAHYFDKAGVAVIRLTDALAVGDTIKVRKGENEFTQTVESMQVEHKPVTSVKTGEEAAVKLSQKTKQGAVVLRVE